MLAEKERLFQLDLDFCHRFDFQDISLQNEIFTVDVLSEIAIPASLIGIVREYSRWPVVYSLCHHFFKHVGSRVNLCMSTNCADHSRAWLAIEKQFVYEPNCGFSLPDFETCFQYLSLHSKNMHFDHVQAILNTPIPPLFVQRFIPKGSLEDVPSEVAARILATKTAFNYRDLFDIIGCEDPSLGPALTKGYPDNVRLYLRMDGNTLLFSYSR
jgi:hypothetical protein